MEVVNKAVSSCNRKRSVHICSNYTGTPNALRGCLDDVKRVTSVLAAQYGFKDSDMLVLSDDAIDPQMQPTRNNIIRVLREVAAQTKFDGVDQVVIQYSGHGTQIVDQNSDEARTGGMDDAWVTKDMQLISDDEIRSILNSFSPFCRVFALIDACHSGTGLDLPLKWVVANPNVVAVTNSSAPTCDVLSISGCEDFQTSADVVRHDNTTGGAMTFAFLENLNTSGSVFDLMNNMRASLQRGGFSQIPQLSSSRVLRSDDNICRWLR